MICLARFLANNSLDVETDFTSFFLAEGVELIDLIRLLELKVISEALAWRLASFFRYGLYWTLYCCL